MIKDVIIDGLLRHLPEDEIIATVHSQFPDARTGPRDLAYYRHKLRKSGHLPPPERRTRSSSRKENTMSDEQKVQEAPAERPTKTIDVLRKAKAEGLSIEDTAKALHEVMDGRDAADKVIKDVIILGILDGKSTDDVVKDVHETFANVASVNPKTGPKDIAYYRTRLRKEYGLEVPSNRATSSKTDVEEVQVGDLNEGGEGEEGEAKPTRKPRAKKAAAAEEAPEADAQA